MKSGKNFNLNKTNIVIGIFFVIFQSVFIGWQYKIGENQNKIVKSELRLETYSHVRTYRDRVAYSIDEKFLFYPPPTEAEINELVFILEQDPEGAEVMLETLLIDSHTRVRLLALAAYDHLYEKMQLDTIKNISLEYVILDKYKIINVPIKRIEISNSVGVLQIEKFDTLNAASSYLLLKGDISKSLYRFDKSVVDFTTFDIEGNDFNIGCRYSYLIMNSKMKITKRISNIMNNSLSYLSIVNDSKEVDRAGNFPMLINLALLESSSEFLPFYIWFNPDAKNKLKQEYYNLLKNQGKVDFPYPGSGWEYPFGVSIRKYLWLK
ncbi:hypothetical protein AB9P05_24560 [Roseivirga sp. BDSF3-8]|uniref:hypothetical protein n=1 Tax=Roseivirga sp. BDSF3-8 TaxID=3241598 RepID=UPI0035318838